VRKSSLYGYPCLLLPVMPQKHTASMIAKFRTEPFCNDIRMISTCRTAKQWDASGSCSRFRSMMDTLFPDPGSSCNHGHAFARGWVTLMCCSIQHPCATLCALPIHARVELTPSESPQVSGFWSRRVYTRYIHTVHSPKSVGPKPPEVSITVTCESSSAALQHRLYLH
jgi:hypothetical protein